MKKFIGIIILVIFQIVSIILFSEWDIISIFGFWAMIFSVIALKKLFNFDDVISESSSADYYTVANEINGRESKSKEKDNKYYLSNSKTKWIYLLAALINGSICVYLIFIR